MTGTGTQTQTQTQTWTTGVTTIALLVLRTGELKTENVILHGPLRTVLITAVIVSNCFLICYFDWTASYGV